MATGSEGDGGTDFGVVARAEAQYIYKYAYPTHMEEPPIKAPSIATATLAADDSGSPPPFRPENHVLERKETSVDRGGSIRSLLLQKYMPSVDGLSLSGGGIRSASFCLGVLEALAEARLLSRFHYISSVSGGGYIAGWLASWCYRNRTGIEGVQASLRDAAKQDAAPPPIQHLLRYVTYLAPRAGLLAVDLWSLISAYARNLFVTLGVTLPVLLIIAAIPYVAALILQVAAQPGLHQRIAGWCVVVSLVLVAVLLRVLAESTNAEQASGKATFARPAAIGLTVIGGAALALTFAADGAGMWYERESKAIGLSDYWLISIVVLLPTALLLVRDAVNGTRAYVAGDQAIASALAMSAALALVVAIDLLARQLTDVRDIKVRLEVAVLAAAASPALWCLVVFSGETLRQALLSRRLNDGDREWMARFVANVMTASVFWLLLCLATYGFPYLVRLSGFAWFAAGFAVSLLVVRRWMAAQFAAIAIVAASGLSLVVAGYGVLNFVERLRAGAPVGQGVASVDPLLSLVLTCIGLAVLAIVIDNFVDVNRFSMHALYRDRLARAFLGASRGVDPTLASDPGVPTDEREQFERRRGSPFHDFDSGDSPRMRCLRSDAGWQRREHWMPVFLFNASLNRTWHSSEPGRLVKAFSFVFSPFFCGSEATQYCETMEYVKNEGGLTLGTAIATSGAALSSRAGRYDSHPLAFFLTLFNLRLGWWLGNPRTKTTRRMAGPQFSLGAYLAEMLGRPYGRRNWVHLSDGGHFENLGAFELIKRGCRRVVVVDGSADEKRQFADLANLIRLVREELNISIEPLSDFQIGKREMAKKGRYCAVFEVLYPEGPRGRLLYIKAAYYPVSTYNPPMEVQNYAMEEPGFPHESTMDQFFTPPQFDAYRRLGQHQMRTILIGSREEAYSVSELMEAASAHAGRPGST